MRNTFPPHRRALAALFPTLALLAVPAVAQEMTAPAAPQQSVPVMPPPVVETAPVPPPTQSAPVQMVQTPPIETAPTPEPQPEPASPRAATRAVPARAVVRHATTRTQSTAVSPAVSEPAASAAATPDITPVATPAPVEEAARLMTVETQAAAPVAAPSAGFDWSSPWLALVGVVLIALAGLLVMGRRRRADRYEDDVAPVAHEERESAPAPAPAMVDPIVAPVAVPRQDVQFLRREAPRAAEAPRAIPAAIDDALPSALAVAGAGELVKPDAQDVAALTAGEAPVADRPWLEMAMRPLRAGTNVDEALVEIELTVGNSGSVSADDVRISTFMFAGVPADDEMERMLLDRDDDAVPPVRIKPGEGRTIEATLALPRASLNGSVSPVIVAEARYSLADGSEGRTSASFRIGVSDEGGAVTSIPIGRPHMHDEVSAELFGVPEHA